MTKKLFESLPDTWPTVHDRAKQYNKLAKAYVRSGDYSAARYWYGLKKKLLVFASIIHGVELELADDDVRMLAVGPTGSRLHLVRPWDIDFVNFESALEKALEQMNALVQTIESGTVTKRNIAKVSRTFLNLPLGDFRLSKQRIRNIMKAYQEGSATLHEAQLAQADAVRVVKGLYPQEATEAEKRRLRSVILKAIGESQGKFLKANTATSVFYAIDGTCLTTRRILRDVLWLQNAVQAKRIEANSDKAIRELVRIGDDLLDRGWQDGDGPDDNGTDGGNGGGSSGKGSPKRPVNPYPGLSAFRMVKPIHDLIIVRPKRLLTIG